MFLNDILKELKEQEDLKFKRKDFSFFFFKRQNSKYLEFFKEDNTQMPYTLTIDDLMADDWEIL